MSLNRQGGWRMLLGEAEQLKSEIPHSTPRCPHRPHGPARWWNSRSPSPFQKYAIIPFAMPSWNEVENAQQRMNAAHEALRAYVKRPSSQPQDIKLHGRLADELRLAVHEYMDLIIEFLMQRPSS